MHAFAILGSNPALSIAELETVTKKPILNQSPQVAIFDDENLSLTELQRTLGGAQKMGHIIGSVIKSNKQAIVDFLKGPLLDQPSGGKVSFGISIYALEDTKRTKEIQGMQKAIGLELKKHVKQAGLPCRYVVSKNPQLSSADVEKNHLLDRGAEFVFFVTEKEILIGQTRVVQDFEDWSHRDYDRPARNAKRGMLPPKLARIMINLTGVNPKGTTILDPFCGSGTVLMEAAMLEYGKLIGSDISPGAVADTKKNLAWLQEQGVYFKEPELKESTAANTKAFLKPLSIDAIATEPFLGNPRKGSESRSDVEAAIRELRGLYQESFSVLTDLLKPGGVMVVASPIHYVNDQAFPVPTKDILTNLGLIERPLSDEPVVYRREGQFVGREIVRFVKKR